jgi:4-oxalocrotonate tautomerase
MPILNLKISGSKDQPLARKIAVELTALTRLHLRKKPEVTSILISFIDDHLWFLGGQSLTEHRLQSFYLDIKVTDSTNLKAEKAVYLKAVFQYMKAVLNGCHPASYVYIEEVKADAYGYGGITMENRIVMNMINSSPEAIRRDDAVHEPGETPPNPPALDTETVRSIVE